MTNLIPKPWQVPPRFRQRVGTHAGKQRAMIEDGHLLLILHDVPTPDDSTRIARLFWRDATGQWKASSGQGNGLASLKRHLEGFQAAVQDLDDKVDKSHNDLVKGADELYDVLRKITPLHRTARHLHKTLQDARDGVDAVELISLRDMGVDLERASELVVADAKNALEYTEAKAAAEQTVFAKKSADAQHRLNLLAALFFPVTAVASVLGTEMHTGIEGAGAWLFWLLIAGSMVLGFFLRGALSK